MIRLDVSAIWRSLVAVSSSMGMVAGMPAYRPFWCEENIWHLAADPLVGEGERRVLLLTGVSGHVACWNQRASAVGEPVLWDYHVVLAVGGDRWRIWDLDTRLACPLLACDWFAGTFPALAQVAATFAPRVLMLSAAEYRRDLWSDRSHMRRADGGWQRPPPPWPALLAGRISLSDYLDRARSGMDLVAATALFG